MYGSMVWHWRAYNARIGESVDVAVIIKAPRVVLLTVFIRYLKHYTTKAYGVVLMTYQVMPDYWIGNLNRVRRYWKSMKWRMSPTPLGGKSAKKIVYYGQLVSREIHGMYRLDIQGQNGRLLGQFPIVEPRFTLGRLINPDNRDSDTSRFLALFGQDARLVANATDMAMVIVNLQSDYPDVELQLDVELENDPEVDVDELVAFVQRISGMDLDALPDQQITLTISQKQGAVARQ
jgi:hypothetical protein